MDEIYDAIRWWENELNPDQRETFLNGETWSGSIEKRRGRLLAFYRTRGD